MMSLYAHKYLRTANRNSIQPSLKQDGRRIPEKRMTRAEYRQRLASLKGPWDAAKAEPAVEEDLPDAPAPRPYSEVVGNRLWGTSSAESFLDPVVFEQEVPFQSGLCDRLKSLRGDFTKTLFVRDRPPCLENDGYGMSFQIGFGRPCAAIVVTK